MQALKTLKICISASLFILKPVGHFNTVCFFMILLAEMKATVTVYILSMTVTVSVIAVVPWVIQLHIRTIF
jgi:hypothetical protein